MPKQKKHTATKVQKGMAIAFLLLIEICVGALIWQKAKPVPAQGYVVKNGNAYLLLWRNSDKSMDSSRHNSLQEALDFADQNLGMKIGPNPTSHDAATHVWAREDHGKKMVFWETENLPVLHRLTFKRPYEASVFENAFKSGAYSTSPYGHSISLVPARR